jgi:NAD-dependent dihydropyrimidine dehydrogenase PreA subunit
LARADAKSGPTKKYSFAAQNVMRRSAYCWHDAIRMTVRRVGQRAYRAAQDFPEATLCKLCMTRCAQGIGIAALR